MIQKNGMHLNYISSVIAKGLNTCVNVIFQLLSFLPWSEYFLSMYMYIGWKTFTNEHPVLFNIQTAILCNVFFINIINSGFILL